MNYVKLIGVPNMLPALLAMLFSFCVIAPCGAAEKERENELAIRRKTIEADLQVLRARQKRQCRRPRGAR